MKKLLVLLFICINSGYTFAQYTPNNGARVSVFAPTKSNSPTPVTTKDSAAGHDNNCIKWNYSLLTRGTLLFNWEFRVTGNLAGEVGLGLTYKDYVFELTKYAGDGPTGNGNSPWDNEGSPAIHLCGEGGLRYYLTGFDNFEGIYVEGKLSYRTYSFPNAPEIGQGGTIVPGYTFFDEQFMIGYQYESSYSDFSYDGYIGVAYRNADLKYYQSTYDPNTGQNITVPVTVHQGFPEFLLGGKIGYSF